MTCFCPAAPAPASAERSTSTSWELTGHARRLIETCWTLGCIPELEPLRLRKWAHMLGFGGHFATKSRTYSTTFGALRQERADFTARQDPYTQRSANPRRARDQPLVLCRTGERPGSCCSSPPAVEPEGASP